MTTQTQPAQNPNTPMSLSVSREYGKAPEGGHRPSITTRVGRAWKHGKGRGINVQVDLTPVLGTDSRLVPFAGKGKRFEVGAERLGAYDVQLTAPYHLTTFRRDWPGQFSPIFVGLSRKRPPYI